jgi:hypothetical protein
MWKFVIPNILSRKMQRTSTAITVITVLMGAGIGI